MEGVRPSSSDSLSSLPAKGDGRVTNHSATRWANAVISEFLERNMTVACLTGTPIQRRALYEAVEIRRHRGDDIAFAKYALRREVNVCPLCNRMPQRWWYMDRRHGGWLEAEHCAYEGCKPIPYGPLERIETHMLQMVALYRPSVGIYGSLTARAWSRSRPPEICISLASQTPHRYYFARIKEEDEGDPPPRLGEAHTYPI